MSTNANPQAEYLRRLGHVEAADALEAATALGATPASGPEQTEQPDRPSTSQEIQEADAKAFLQQLEAGRQSKWMSVGPAIEGS